MPVVFVLSKNVSTPSLVRDRDNFPIEEHSLKTSDGYYLTIFRINFLEPSDKPVVLLMHGLFGSSDDYVVNGAERSLAQILAADGFDVWLGNSRGNKYCKKHDFLSSLDPRFWSFEWHDIAMKDLPAIINYVLETSKADKLSYVGHSQGGTIFLVLNSMDPQFGKKTIRSAHLLAPACFVGNARTELRALAPILGASNILGTSFGAEVLAESPLLEVVCKGRNYDSLCVNLINLFGGFDYTLVNEVTISRVVFNFYKVLSFRPSLMIFSVQFHLALLGNRFNISFKEQGLRIFSNLIMDFWEIWLCIVRQSHLNII